jgi:hypothetical protein
MTEQKTAAAAYVIHVEAGVAYPWRNLAPFAVVLLLCWQALRRGGGSWTGRGWTWPLGILGFAIPAVGLSLYLHYGYANDLDGMYSEAVFPEELFRYLPGYTLVAGAIGFAIGWRIGRNV